MVRTCSLLVLSSGFSFRSFRILFPPFALLHPLRLQLIKRKPKHFFPKQNEQFSDRISNMRLSTANPRSQPGHFKPLKPSLAYSEGGRSKLNDLGSTNGKQRFTVVLLRFLRMKPHAFAFLSRIRLLTTVLHFLFISLP